MKPPFGHQGTSTELHCRATIDKTRNIDTDKLAPRVLTSEQHSHRSSSREQQKKHFPSRKQAPTEFAEAAIEKAESNKLKDVRNRQIQQIMKKMGVDNMTFFRLIFLFRCVNLYSDLGDE